MQIPVRVIRSERNRDRAVAAEAPAQDASCPTISGFTLSEMQDSPGSDYKHGFSTVEDAARNCFKDTDCAAVYVDGSPSYTWFKNKVILPLIDYNDEGKELGKCRGIYIKTDPPPNSVIKWSGKYAHQDPLAALGMRTFSMDCINH